MSVKSYSDGLVAGIKTVRAQAAKLRNDASNLDRIADSLTDEAIDQSERVSAKITADDDRALAELARKIYKLRQTRERHFPAMLFSEPAWNMLLDLFANQIDGTAVGISNLAIASGSTPTTGLRYIDLLAGLDLVHCEQSSDDSQEANVRLTTLGADQMRKFLNLPELQLLK